MTARYLLERRLRWLNYVIWTGLVLVQTGIILSWVLGRPPLLVVILPGFALMAIGMGPAYTLLLRCPRCRGDVSSLLLGNHKCDSAQLPACSSCGVSLNEELS